MTIKDVAAMDVDMLTPAQIAPILKSDPQTVRMQARMRPDLLGFPTICIGSRVKIPRIPFLNFLGYQIRDEESA